MELKKLRNEIESTDKEIVALFCKRMEISSLIATEKQALGMEIYDKNREAEVMEAVTRNANEKLSPYVRELYVEIMKLSKDYQRDILSEKKL